MIRKRRRKKSFLWGNRRELHLLVAGALLAAMIAGAFPSACVTRLPGDQNALQQIEDLARNVDDGGARRP